MSDVDEPRPKQKGRGFREAGKGKDSELSNARFDSLEPGSGDHMQCVKLARLLAARVRGAE